MSDRASIRVVAACAAALGLHAGTARAQSAGWQGTRALGMGGALRAAATGDSGPTLNPSGISLIRAYTAEAGYQVNDTPSPGVTHRAHASLVDSTSGAGVGGALYYSYLASAIATGIDQSGHEAGASLSFPFGDRFAAGATLKYLKLSTTTNVPPAPKFEDRLARLTFDVGATIRPVSLVSIGLVGYNLVDSGTALAPRALGWGASVMPNDNFLIVFDGTADLSSSKYLPGGGDRTLLTLMGGVEYVTPIEIAVRAGGGRDGVRDNGYLTVGASGVSQVGAIDVALLRDVAGDGKQTIFAVSVRLFVPAP